MILSVHLLLFFCCGLSLAQIQNETQTELESSESWVSQTEFAAMKEVVENLQKDSKIWQVNYKNQIAAVKERLEVLEENLKNSTDQIDDLRRQASIQVIFSAGIEGDRPIGPFYTDKTLIYNSVFTNIGSGYNQSTGIFTAPVPGVYYLTFFYLAGGNQSVFLRLYKNNEVIAESIDHASDSDTADNGGRAVFVQLQRGDQVYVRMRSHTHVWGRIHATTFSGFLVTLL